MSTFFSLLGLYCFSAAIFTFFTGFGLQLVLTPLLLFYFPLDRAVFAAALVHLFIASFHLVLSRARSTPIDFGVVVRFGLPAAIASAIGAALFGVLRDLPPYHLYALGLKVYAFQAFTIATGLGLTAFTVMDSVQTRFRLDRKASNLAIGGALSGFFGGLVGLADPLQAASIQRGTVRPAAPTAATVTGAAPTAATIAVIAILIDLPRIALYTPTIASDSYPIEHFAIATAVLGASAGMMFGEYGLDIGVQKSTRRTTGFALALTGLLLASGMLQK